MTRIDDKTFIEAVKQSTSIRQILKKLGLAPAGGNYSTIHRRIASLHIDTSHFLGQAHNRGKYHGPKRPIEDYLSNRAYMQSDKLKKRLISEGIFEHRCSSCKLTEWLGNPMPLELEHKDGNHRNNYLNNLCLLCPNCHTFTPTYRGKNIGKRHGIIQEEIHMQDTWLATLT